MSAMSAQTKRSSLFQEGIRRWQNISPELPHETKMEILEKLMNTLRVSGYNLAYRLQLLKGIIQRISECEQHITEGTRFRYRNGTQIAQEKMGNYPNTWFQKGDVSGIIKVQQTPGGKLANLLRKHLKNVRGPDVGSIKVVEKGGQVITSGIQVPRRWGEVKDGCQYLLKCNVRKDKDCRVGRCV